MNTNQSHHHRLDIGLDNKSSEDHKPIRADCYEASDVQYTVDQALDAIGFGRFQWMLLLLSGIGFFATTIELILVSLIQPSLRAEWPLLTNKLQGLLLSLTFAGELVGGLVWGLASDRLGRRIPFLVTSAIAALFGCGAAFAPCYYTFIMFRFALGFAIGGSLSIDIVYFVEFVPAKSRGFRTTFIILLGILACTTNLTNFCQVSFVYLSFVVFYTAGMGFWLLPNWRKFVFACGAPNIFLFVGRLFWRWESPRFLLTRDRVYEADQVLQTMSRWNGRQLPRGRLAPLSATTKSISLPEPNPAIAANVASARWKEITKIATASILFFCQTFGYYGLTVWIRNLSNALQIASLDPCMTFLVIGVAELAGLALTTSLVERIGRRGILLINFLGSALVSVALLAVSTRTAFLIVNSTTYFFIVGSWAGMYMSI